METKTIKSLTKSTGNHVKSDSGKDINDKFMREAGFYRSKMDRPDFNKSDDITYWTNDMGLVLLTDKRYKITLEEFADKVANQAAYWTRKRIKLIISRADSGGRGFVRFDES